MTTTQEDYELAQLAVEDNLIRFFVEVKVETQCITFQKKEGDQPDEENLSADEERSNSSKDYNH